MMRTPEVLGQAALLNAAAAFFAAALPGLRLTILIGLTESNVVETF